MAVYFIVDVNIDDPQSYAEYSKQVGPMVARYGGRFLVRGGATSTIEGDWQPQRLVVLEYADTERFRAWYDSPEYVEIRAIRFKASTARAVLSQGVEQKKHKWPNLSACHAGALIESFFRSLSEIVYMPQ